MEGPSLNVIIGANLQKLQSEMQKANGMLHGFQEKALEIGSTLGVAFSVERIGEFALEVSKLAGQSQGVKNAFDQLQNSANVLYAMKEATQGTVSELDLMKSAVQANNFNIPLEQMGKLFEFAHQRAIATGQSVDYLVQSIVTGIGRKSPLILDNLGISAIALKEKLKGVGTETATVADVAKAVGDIAEESLNKFGRAAETTASRMEKLNASWENFKVQLGTAINNSGLVDKALETLGNTLNVLGSENLSIWQKLLALQGGYHTLEMANKIDEIKQQQKLNEEKQKEANIMATVKAALSSGNVEGYIGALGQNVNKEEIIRRIREAQKQTNTAEVIDLNTIAGIEARIKELRDKQLTAHGALIHSIELEITALNKKEKLLKEGGSGFKAPDVSKNLKGVITLREEYEKLAAAAHHAALGNTTLQHTLEKLDRGVQHQAKSFAQLNKWIDENQKKTDESTKKTNQAYQQQLQTMQQVGQEIGSQMGAVLAGHESFAQAMGRITIDMIGKYAMKAVAAAGAGAAESGGPWAVAAAAAAMAAMAALFSSMGVSGGGGGGGGSSIPRAADTNHNRGNTNTPALHINLGGNFKLQGNTLVASLRKANYSVSKTGG